MGNCLKIQLKESVNNDNLSKFGLFQISLGAHTESAGNYMKVRFAKVATAKSLNSYFSDVTIPANTDTYIPIVGSADTIEFDSKYDLVYLEIKNLNIQAIKWNDFGAWGDNTVLDAILINESSLNTTFYGSVKKLVNATVTKLLLGRLKGVTDKLEDFGHLVNLTTLSIGDSGITGPIEKFVAAQVRKGRDGSLTPVTIETPWLGTIPVTFNRERFSPSESTTISWQPNATAGRTDVTLSGVGQVTIDNATGNIVS